MSAGSGSSSKQTAEVEEEEEFAFKHLLLILGYFNDKETTSYSNL